MLRRILPGIVLSTALAAPGFAQTVDELISRNVVARGGLAKLGAVTSVRMSGTLSMGAMELPIVLELKRPASVRSEVAVQGSRVVEAFDGKDAWAIPPGPGAQPVKLPAAAAKDKAEQADLDGPLVDYQTKGHQVELLGKERLDGGDAFKVKLIRKGGGVEYYFLDAKSYLLVRVAGKRRVQGEELEGDSTLGDYREAGGVMWAHSIHSGAKGQPERQNLTFTKIEVNPTLDDSRFRMPAGARPLEPPR